ncbi:MAG: hypothetical protein EA365_16660 [Gloeocapsa sp. DLM2.Bin57]|nr:MAG: hypothetical protein EA365_16660 [Gloeocapsa sp. DLM2.Bin57]
MAKLNNNTSIYIQSRGITPEDDYCWLKIEDNNQVTAIPEILNRLSLVSLIDSQMFSLVLAYQQPYFILLVTGLEATPPELDFMGRKIRNSLLWISPEEAQIRSLTVAALEGQLANALEEIIYRDNNLNNSFRIDTDQLEKLTDLVKLNYYNNSYNPAQLGNNNETLRQQLALEIQTNCLPTNRQLLIVITSIKSAIDLERLKVWRGLSNRISSDELTPTTATEKKTLVNTAVIATATAITIFLIISMLF